MPHNNFILWLRLRFALLLLLTPPLLTRRLFFEALDVTSGMPELEQSSVDSVVDVGLLDKLVITMVREFQKSGVGLEKALCLTQPSWYLDLSVFENK